MQEFYIENVLIYFNTSGIIYFIKNRFCSLLQKKKRQILSLFLKYEKFIKNSCKVNFYHATYGVYTKNRHTNRYTDFYKTSYCLFSSSCNVL